MQAQMLETKIKNKTLLLVSREECMNIINRRNTTMSKLLQSFREYAVKSNRYGEFYEVSGLINLPAFIDYLKYEDEFRNGNRGIPIYNPKLIENELIRDTPKVDMQDVVNEMLHSQDFMKTIKDEVAREMLNKFQQAVV